MRRAALLCVKEGKRFGEICDFFKITPKTLYNWRKSDSEIPVTTRKIYNKSNNLRIMLQQEVESNPDATLLEFGKKLNKSARVIFYHLEQMGITRKKNQSLQGARRGKKTRISCGD